MKLEDLVEFWTMLLDASEGKVVVSRDMADRTRAALVRLDKIGDQLSELCDLTEDDVE